MRSTCILAMLCAASLAAASDAPPAGPWTPADSVRRARERSPAVVQAAASAQAARVRAGAAAASPEHGSLEWETGPRYSGGDLSLDAGVAWETPLDGGQRRARRVTAAEAEALTATHALDESRRLAGAEALAAHYRALHAARVADLARQRLALSRELLATARGREEVGDVARFDVNAATVEVALSESALLSDLAAPTSARLRLGAVLAMDAGALDLHGSLEDRGLLAGLAALAADPAAVARRPDVRHADAAIASAEAGVALARSQARPPLAFRLAAEREEDSEALHAGLVIPLASPARTRAELEVAAIDREAAVAVASARRSVAAAEIAAALAAHEAAIASVRVLAEQGLALAEENAGLAREGYAAGKFDLASYLVIRRDALAAQREHLDRLLDAALTGVELWAALGAPLPGDAP